MKIYLAASYRRRGTMKKIAAKARRMGHEVVSRWIDGDTEAKEFKRKTRVSEAIQDLCDIIRCKLLIYFSSKGGRGGKDVELGYALANGKMVWMVGKLRNIFHHVPFVTFKNADQMLKELGKTE